MKNRKLQFIRAVRLLAPHDKLVLEFAKGVEEASLPNYPGAAALEFVYAMQRILGTTSCPRRLRRHRPPSHPTHRPKRPTR